MRKSMLLNILAAIGVSVTATVAQNTAPTAKVLDATAKFDGKVTISYILYDAEEDAADLRYGLYLSPHSDLKSAFDVRIFATLIVDERDAVDDMGTGKFVEGTSADNERAFIWTEPSVAVQIFFGYAAPSSFPPADFYVYIVADDGNNDPVVGVSSVPLRIGGAPTSVGSATWAQVKSSLER